jgi:hypothetical protein
MKIFLESQHLNFGQVLIIFNFSNEQNDTVADSNTCALWRACEVLRLKNLKVRQCDNQR